MTLTSEEIDQVEEPQVTVADPAPKSRRWLFWTPLALVVLLLLGLIVNFFIPVPVLGGKAERQLAEQTEARDQICSYAPILATYDYHNLNPYYSQVLDRATGDFKDQFNKGKGELGNWLQQGEVISKAKGVSCGVDASGDTLRIIIGISQAVQSLATSGTAMDTTLSVVADVEKQDGKWMITKVDGPLLK